MKKISLKRIGFSVGGALLAAIVGLNSFTIVTDGTVKVQKIFGKVQDTELTAGFHLVNPLSSFQVVDTRPQKYEEMGITIPTNDRFNSTANLTIIYQIDRSMAAQVIREYGTAANFANIALKQQTKSIVRDEGRKLEDSRALAVSSNVSAMQQNTFTRLASELSGKGLQVNEVLIQEIQFDPKISQQILATQQRIQKEEQEKSQLRIAETQAQTAEANAEGKANAAIEAARGKAESLVLAANADKDAAIARAAGDAEAILLVATAQAEANELLTQSLTPAIIRMRELENEQILFERSQGNVPTTIIGDTDLRAIGVPVATSVTGK